MKNSMTDLNNHLFMQLERLSEEDLSEAQIAQEAKRAEAIVSVAEQIVSNAQTQLKAATLFAQHGNDVLPMLPQVASSKTIEGKAK
ncbi:hypothetical protein [Celeribacter halophilus]|jgi:3-methyladenine DNA glycosylase/8-oxoguanine DNA glycosylase|uniref:hypothetical protein n=1 Tax=Celeribacter halophilus TaxID=576117 RepID=UPI003A9485F9